MSEYIFLFGKRNTSCISAVLGLNRLLLILQLSFSEKILSFCSWLAEQVSTVVNKVSRPSPEAHQPLVELIDSLKKKYSVPGAPWDVLLPTGSGTFEGYVGWGAGCGASADGRRSGSPIASDLSAAPTPLDKPPVPKSFDIYK